VDAPRKAVVVGLGNPGWRYRRTRHNIGFRVVEEMARRGRVRFRRSYRMAARIAPLERAGQEVLLVEPQTYMNRSGLTVRAVMVEFDRRREELVVVVDDASLPLGRLRVRPEGSDGGHNGLKSIVEVIGSTEFARVRVGIGPGGGDGLTDHVLGKFSRAERPLVAKVVEAAADAVETMVNEGVGPAMNTFNGMDLAAAEPSGAVEE
jgi:PTH1 family peptidyl-tRNA hydrolase